MKKPQKRTQLNCKRCGHVWLSKINPLVCPVCHNDFRFKKKIKMSKIKRRNLKYLDNLKNKYGEDSSIKNILNNIENEK